MLCRSCTPDAPLIVVVEAGPGAGACTGAGVGADVLCSTIRTSVPQHPHDIISKFVNQHGQCAIYRPAEPYVGIIEGCSQPLQCFS